MVRTPCERTAGTPQNRRLHNIAGLRGTAALALSLCSRLASARSAIHPFPNIAGLAVNRSRPSLCSRLPRARSQFTLSLILQGFAVKPLSPSRRFAPFQRSTPQFTLSLILQGFAVKPLSPLALSPFSSARSAIHPFPNIAGLRGEALRPLALLAPSQRSLRNSPFP